MKSSVMGVACILTPGLTEPEGLSCSHYDLARSFLDSSQQHPVPRGGSPFPTVGCTPASRSSFQPGHSWRIPQTHKGNMSASPAKWQDLKLLGSLDRFIYRPMAQPGHTPRCGYANSTHPHFRDVTFSHLIR